ncbi:hypothetical protein AB0I98_27770 [Streptomyces sp. NPDC050211]
MNPDAEAVFARHMARIAARDLVDRGETADARTGSTTGQQS